MRRLIAQQFQVSGQNDFALLDHIGGECAGAVTFLKPGQALPVPSRNDGVQWLSDKSLPTCMNCRVDLCWQAKTACGFSWL